MKKQAARLVCVSAGPGSLVSVTYSDGRQLRVDMSELVARLASFAPLENATEFATAKVADFGWTLEWDCGASLDADRVIEMALAQSGMAANVDFRHWQDTNRFSLTDAAAAIGVSRRTVSQYRTGSRPVPRYIALACKGWDAEQRHAA